MRIGYFSFLVVLLSGCQLFSTQKSLPEGITLIEEKKVDADNLGINYQKYRLKNGLTVLLHQDNSDPLVHVDMTYHVGSARETPGRSGFAHFFEHMMFQGSKHVADQQHIKMIIGSGGEVNGSTNRDRTNYYQTVPANELEKVLWLESDRMGFLLSAVSQKKFEIQRDTVKNERAQNYENRPYGLVGETLSSAIFPQNHPYSWPTIGYVEDLDRADVNDLKEFFLKWYGPNNATISIGGDIDVANTLEMVNKYFSEIPSAPEVKKAEVQPVPALKADRFVTLEDKITQPLLVISWPTQYPKSADKVPLDMLASILGQGRNSLLYTALVKTEKALSVNTSQNCGELACLFRLSVLGKEGQSLGELYKLVNEQLDKLAKTGIPVQKLEQIKSMAESDAVFALESVHGKVAHLAINQTIHNDPDRLQLWLNKLNAVTEAQVNQAFKDYIFSKHKVVLSVVPMKKTALAVKKANFTVSKQKYLANVEKNLVKEKNQEPKTLSRNTPISFDRSQIPKKQKSVKLAIPKLYKAKFSNGIELVGSYVNETPTVTAHLLFPAGKLMDPADKIGLSAITARLLEEGTQKRTSEEINAELDKIGASLSVYNTAESSVVSLSSLNKNFLDGLRIAKEVFFEPKFDEKDFNRLKKQTLEKIKLSKQTSNWLAEQAKRNVLYQDPWWRLPMIGTEETINNISLEDVKKFYRDNYTPDKARLIVVGDLKKSEVVKQLAPITNWKGGKAALVKKAEVKHYSKPHIWLVDKEGAPQSVIKFVRNALPFDATGEMFRLQLVNFPFAGNFNSRLNLNLREDKGYTYGVSGGVQGAKKHGSLEFSTSVRANNTVEAIKEIQTELAKMSSKGITDEELNFLRLAIGEKKALNYETPSDKAGLISHMMRYKLPEDFTEKQHNILRNITKDELNAYAAKWYNPDDYQIIVVGDAKTLKPKLEKLGLEVKSATF